MTEWIAANAPVLQLVVTGVTAMVWVVYLQTFLSGYRRQQRSMILVTAGAGRGMNSHCLVTNLGLEPISILSIIIDVSDGARTARAVIPDRNELMIPEGNDDAQATNQGPMPSGSLRDLGRFSTLLSRAAAENPDMEGMEDATRIEITVVVATVSALAGASRGFVRMNDTTGTACLRPGQAQTVQLRSRRQRAALFAILQADIPPAS